MKNWSSLRTKAIKNYLPLYRYRWGLTGTPVPNGLVDIFSQVYMLDLGERFGTKITRFRDMYFQQPTKWQYKRLPFKGTPQIIYEKLESLAFRVKASDWLDLPEEIHNPILLPFPDELRATYAELKKEFVVRLKTQVITAGSASVLSTKLRQLLSGNIYDANREAVFVHHYKLKALQDFIVDCDGRPVLVAYQYRHEVEMFKKYFSKASFIDTSTSPANRARIITEWNEGEIPILFGHPASIGHGLNLQGGGNTVLFYSLDFNLDNYLQFIKRVARQGQKADTVIIHYLVFENTIDEFILEILQGKADVQNGLLDYLEA
jgi:SNF2 family DNA or RNA helicase